MSSAVSVSSEPSLKRARLERTAPSITVPECVLLVAGEFAYGIIKISRAFTKSYKEISSVASEYGHVGYEKQALLCHKILKKKKDHIKTLRGFLLSRYPSSKTNIVKQVFESNTPPKTTNNSSNSIQIGDKVFNTSNIRLFEATWILLHPTQQIIDTWESIVEDGSVKMTGRQDECVDVLNKILFSNNSNVSSCAKRVFDAWNYTDGWIRALE